MMCMTPNELEDVRTRRGLIRINGTKETKQFTFCLITILLLYQAKLWHRNSPPWLYVIYTGHGYQTSYVVPWGSPQSPAHFLQLKMEGGKERGRRNLTRAGQASLFTKTCVGPFHLPTGGFSRWFDRPRPCPSLIQWYVVRTRVMALLSCKYIALFQTTWLRSLSL